ncbi:MAG: elongation factor Ts, partial [Psychroserpens sp.]|nr:elongation factor Ts [Psychroserpens sp.]
LDQEQCLLDQKFIKDEKQTVAQYVDTYGEVAISGFKRVTVG